MLPLCVCVQVCLTVWQRRTNAPNEQQRVARPSQKGVPVARAEREGGGKLGMGSLSGKAGSLRLADWHTH